MYLNRKVSDNHSGGDDAYKNKISESKKGKPGRVWTQEQKDKLRDTRLKQIQSAKALSI